MKQTFLSENIKSILTLFLALVIEAFLFMAFIISNDTNTRTQVVTAQIALIVGISGYYYGYSQGASKKDEAQAALTANSQTTTTATTTSPVDPNKIPEPPATS